MALFSMNRCWRKLVEVGGAKKGQILENKAV